MKNSSVAVQAITSAIVTAAFGLESRIRQIQFITFSAYSCQ